MFYKSQAEVAEAINKIIDAYWKNEVEETLMITELRKLFENNYTKITNEGKYTKIIEQRCGKRRLEVLSKIINLNIKQS